MPGSPTSSVTEPGTRPPPSTRSSSPTPVDTGADVAALTSAIGTGPLVGRISPAGRLGTAGASSTSVPHSPQDGQRPSQRGDSSPHSRHRCTERVFMAATVRGGYDSHRPAPPSEPPGYGR